jgi:hypothetical protein
VLSNLHVAQGHADVFVPEQLHESRKADAEADHLEGIAVPQAVWRYRTGAGRSLASRREVFPKPVIQGLTATETRQ